MLQVGLQVDTASRALQLMRISFEKLQFGEELTAFIESHPELIVDGKELKLPLYYEHIHAWNVHIKNLEHWLQTQQGGYQAALLH